MSELSKNKKLKKLYDYGDRITPQKWAKAMDILSPYSPPEDAPVINTTYKEAKAIYEAGEMKTGVYYRFNYHHEKSFLYNFGEDDVCNTVINEFPINVFIDKYGDLKAKGFYEYLTSDVLQRREFIADYTFDIVAANLLTDEYDDRRYHQYLVFRKVTIYCENPSNLEKLLIKHNIPFNKLIDDEGYYKICPKMTCVTFNRDTTVIYVFNNGVVIHNDDGYFDEKDSIEFVETGLLYNIDYGSYKHSYLFEGYTKSEYDSNREFFISIVGDINNQLDNYIYIEYCYDNADLKVDIKNCDIYVNVINYPFLIYAINTKLSIEYFDSDLIYGDKYYGETKYIGE